MPVMKLGNIPPRTALQKVSNDTSPGKLRTLTAWLQRRGKAIDGEGAEDFPVSIESIGLEWDRDTLARSPPDLHALELKRYNTLEGQCLPDHHEIICGYKMLHFSPCGTLLVARVPGSSLSLWDMNTATKRGALRETMGSSEGDRTTTHSSQTCMYFSSNRRRLTVGMYHSRKSHKRLVTTVYDLSNWKSFSQEESTWKELWSDDDRLLGFLSYDRLITCSGFPSVPGTTERLLRIWNVSHHASIQLEPIQMGFVKEEAIFLPYELSPDGKVVLSIVRASPLTFLHVHDLNMGRLIVRDIPCYAQPAPVFGPDSKFVVFLRPFSRKKGGNGICVCVLEIATGSVRELAMPANPLLAKRPGQCALSPGGKYVFWIHNVTKDIRIWDVAADSQVKHTCAMGVDFVPELLQTSVRGALAITGKDRSEIELWELPHEMGPLSISWSQDADCSASLSSSRSLP
jgi:WD40 repeat protein